MVQKNLRRPESAGRLERKLKDLRRERRSLEGQIERSFMRDEYEDASRRLRAVNKEIAEIEEVLDR